MKATFTDIVLNSKWSQHPCGPGSTMNYTSNLRNELVPFLKRYDITSMLDLPCGDFSWMSTTEIDQHIDYIGGEIINELVDQNKTNYPKIDFRVLDLTKDPLPKVDLLFCRDCLLHLSFADIELAFENIARSNIEYILLSNWYSNAQNNKDIKTGQYRFIDFQKEPYQFGIGLDSIDDWIEGYAERRMVLWPVDIIRKHVK